MLPRPYYELPKERIKLKKINIDQVILSYLQGEATTIEIEVLRKWMNESKDHKAIFDSTKLYWEQSKLEVKSGDVDIAYSKLRKKSKQNFADNAINVYNINRDSKINWYKIAAACIVFFTLAGMIYFVNNSNAPLVEHILVTEVVKKNPKGQKLTTYLPDGSKVILNSQSTIRYKTPFTGNERLIELEGEAFFEVMKDTLLPFRVLSEDVSITALGTSFNVNSKNKNQVEVVLVTGKVKVSKDPNHLVILNPGKSAIVNQSGEIEVHEFNYLDKVGWKDGVLAFNDDSLSEIIMKLENWYGVEFIPVGELENNFHYTGTYENETLEEVLHGISFVHHFKFNITGDTVKIFAN